VSLIRITVACCEIAAGGFAANSGHALLAWIMGILGGYLLLDVVIDARNAEKKAGQAHTDGGPGPGAPSLKAPKS